MDSIVELVAAPGNSTDFELSPAGGNSSNFLLASSVNGVLSSTPYPPPVESQQSRGKTKGFSLPLGQLGPEKPKPSIFSNPAVWVSGLIILGVVVFYFFRR